ncbi:MAG: hypothetical protein LUD69_04455 [Oscillospiraceae bacterium]|nr:hypothetical protein [Oscillospiraceae bacterium]
MSKTNDLDILEKAFLGAKIRKELISVGGYKEESFCVEKRGSNWVGYWGERGVEHDAKKFKSPVAACHYLISMMSGSSEERASITKRFNIALRASKAERA